MADSESAPLLDECTMVLGVSDHTMAMHQWMLLSAALRRRPEYAALLADPRLRPATVAKKPAAVSMIIIRGSAHWLTSYPSE